MEKKLLLLGLLRNQETHGYQLNDLIDTHFGDHIDLKKPTLYDLLKKMTDDGWIESREEQAGNRPIRRVYVIKEAGEAAFQSLVRESLAAYEPLHPDGDIGLMFLDSVPAAEALPLLRERRAAIGTLFKHLEEHGGHDVSAGHPGQGGVHGGQEAHPGSLGLVIERHRRLLAAELEFIDFVVGRLEETTAAED